MDWNFIITLLGTIFGLLGILIAIYQSREKKRIERIIRANNWFNYERANISNGILQDALKLYKARHSNDINIDVFEKLAMSDAFGQEVYMGVIRQIQMFESSFSQKDIERWRNEGKIADAKVGLFMKFVIEEKRMDLTRKNNL